jgi:hypothetical protein
LGLVAVAAVDGAIAARLEGNGGLLSAAGANDGCAARFCALVASASASPTCLLVLLRLAARFAALGRRVSALLEERLIFASKRKFLSAVATGEL